MTPADPHEAAWLRQVRPPDWVNPKPAARYNLVVVGAGTAGLVAAAGAAGLGARVALVERGLMALHGWVLSPPASGHHPPQHYGSVAAVVLAGLFLALSLQTRPSRERHPG